MPRLVLDTKRAEGYIDLVLIQSLKLELVRKSMLQQNLKCLALFEFYCVVKWWIALKVKLHRVCIKLLQKDFAKLREAKFSCPMQNRLLKPIHCINIESWTVE